MRSRTDTGATSFWVIALVALVAGVIAAIPFVAAGRQEARSGRYAVAQVDEANDVSAEVMLHSALQAAAAYFGENGSYQGFGPSFASQFDLSVEYSSGAAAPGVVSIGGVTPTSVVLVTKTASGYLCAGQNTGVVTYGRANARTAAGCTGGW